MSAKSDAQRISHEANQLQDPGLADLLRRVGRTMEKLASDLEGAEKKIRQLKNELGDHSHD